MNRDDIIRMAREAGYIDSQFTPITTLERFAALVAAAEREACARVCDEKREEWGWDDDGQLAARDCANAIRARGEGLVRKTHQFSNKTIRARGEE